MVQTVRQRANLNFAFLLLLLTTFFPQNPFLPLSEFSLILCYHVILSHNHGLESAPFF